MKKRINYTNFNCPLEGTTLIEGIRGVNGSNKVYVSGALVISSELTCGLLYEGPLDFNGLEGKWHQLTFTAEGVENVVNTSCYGPNGLENGDVQLVGAYQANGSSNNMGFFYEGPADGSGTWTTISPNQGETEMVFVHSVMGGYAVGNYDTKPTNGFAFLYNIKTQEFTDIAVKNADTTTLYGIWHNEGPSYTLAGGCSLQGISQAFIVDWDSETGRTSNWKIYQYLNEKTKSLITHFEGITSDGNGGYNLASDWVAIDAQNGTHIAQDGAFVNIQRNQDGTFSEAEWVELGFPVQGVTATSANTAFENNILGIYTLPHSTNGTKSNYTLGFTATIV
ncbi:MAG: hypothetical protein JKY54_10630 [Flavobacteriales bacterium]|nr:hypothetical protein [Flavobacteriales bacterium]